MILAETRDFGETLKSDGPSIMCVSKLFSGIKSRPQIKFNKDFILKDRDTIEIMHITSELIEIYIKK